MKIVVPRVAEPKKTLPAAARDALLATLQARFATHAIRHPGMDWADVRVRLDEMPGKLWSLHQMETTGGQPDVLGKDETTGEVVFFDCSKETPKERVSVCYDRAGWESRQDHRPKDTAMDMAAMMGVEILTEAQYHKLQELGEFDLKTSSWVKTPPDLRDRGGALYGERRYDRVFIGHNGAQSYYGVRGFRASLRV